MPATTPVIRLLGRKYTYDILKSLENRSRRFKEMADVCKGEKMRAQRLKELRSVELIKVRAKRVEGRPVSIYSLSEKGKRTIKLAEELQKLEV